MSPLRALAVCFLAFVFFPACRTTGDKGSDKDPKPIGDLVERSKVPESIGKLIADLDLELNAWTRLKMTAATAEDRNKARELEKVIATTAHARRGELIDQLQTGPPGNRIVVAFALGFTRDPEALSPLVASLEDSNTDVVGNALLGLMVLGNRDAPLDRICDLMRESSDPRVRTNAAQCLSNLVAAGAEARNVLATARLGISDTEPGVRTHSALMLGSLLDTESVVGLIDLVRDPVPLVSAAALHALVWIGKHQDKSKGNVARGLAAQLETARTPQRTQLLRALNELSGVNYGD